MGLGKICGAVIICMGVVFLAGGIAMVAIGSSLEAAIKIGFQVAWRDLRIVANDKATNFKDVFGIDDWKGDTFYDYSLFHFRNPEAVYTEDTFEVDVLGPFVVEELCRKYDIQWLDPIPWNAQDAFERVEYKSFCTFVYHPGDANLDQEIVVPNMGYAIMAQQIGDVQQMVIERVAAGTAPIAGALPADLTTNPMRIDGGLFLPVFLQAFHWYAALGGAVQSNPADLAQVPGASVTATGPDPGPFLCSVAACKVDSAQWGASILWKNLEIFVDGALGPLPPAVWNLMWFFFFETAANMGDPNAAGALAFFGFDMTTAAVARQKMNTFLSNEYLKSETPPNPFFTKSTPRDLLFGQVTFTILLGIPLPYDLLGSTTGGAIALDTWTTRDLHFADKAYYEALSLYHYCHEVLNDDECVAGTGCEKCSAMDSNPLPCSDGTPVTSCTPSGTTEATMCCGEEPAPTDLPSYLGGLHTTDGQYTGATKDAKDEWKANSWYKHNDRSKWVFGDRDVSVAGQDVGQWDPALEVPLEGKPSSDYKDEKAKVWSGTLGRTAALTKHGDPLQLYSSAEFDVIRYKVEAAQFSAEGETDLYGQPNTYNMDPTLGLPLMGTYQYMYDAGSFTKTTTYFEDGVQVVATEDECGIFLDIEPVFGVMMQATQGLQMSFPLGEIVGPLAGFSEAALGAWTPEEKAVHYPHADKSNYFAPAVFSDKRGKIAEDLAKDFHENVFLLVEGVRALGALLIPLGAVMIVLAVAFCACGGMLCKKGSNKTAPA